MCRRRLHDLIQISSMVFLAVRPGMLSDIDIRRRGFLGTPGPVIIKEPCIEYLVLLQDLVLISLNQSTTLGTARRALHAVLWQNGLLQCEIRNGDKSDNANTRPNDVRYARQSPFNTCYISETPAKTWRCSLSRRSGTFPPAVFGAPDFLSLSLCCCYHRFIECSSSFPFIHSRWTRPRTLICREEQVIILV